MTHALLTLLVQIGCGFLARAWFAGGFFMSAFYLGREITQAEYRWISQFGAGRRANMPWWGGFDPLVWNAKSLADAFLPVLVTLLVYLVAHRLGWTRRPGA